VAAAFDALFAAQDPVAVLVTAPPRPHPSRSGGRMPRPAGNYKEVREKERRGGIATRDDAPQRSTGVQRLSSGPI
jgi:hypothetical protein